MHHGVFMDLDRLWVPEALILIHLKVDLLAVEVAFLMVAVLLMVEETVEDLMAVDLLTVDFLAVELVLLHHSIPVIQVPTVEVSQTVLTYLPSAKPMFLPPASHFPYMLIAPSSAPYPQLVSQEPAILNLNCAVSPAGTSIT